MKKLDLIRQEKSYYEAKTAPRLVKLKEYKYLTIEGISAPEDPVFSDAISAIYAVAYAIKFYCKSEDRDFVVPKLEGQWWVEGPLPFEKTPRDQWHWKLLIPLPNFVTATLFNRMREQAAVKKKLESISKVKMDALNEGLAVQILHIGSYEEEAGSIDQVVRFLNSKDLKIGGRHHEIYMSDPFRTPKERLKTIIRYPVKQVS